MLLASTLGLSGLEAQEPLNEAEMLLFSVVLEQRALHESLPVYPFRNSYLVPLGEICRSLTLGIKVQESQGQASGFIIQEKRKFHLDLASATVVFDGKRAVFDPARIVRKDGDFYVDLSLLQEWLPMTFTADRSDSSITVKTREQLPIQEDWERQRRLMRGDLEEAPVSKGKLTEYPFSFIDFPFVDQTLTLTHASGQAKKVEGSGTTFLSGDLLWMSASAYFTLDSKGKTSNPRMSLFREDPSGHMLGPMKARTVMVGDLSVPPMEFLGSVSQSRGLLLSSFPQNFQSTLDRRDFRGSLPPGWSVELFQNGAIVGFQRSRPDGQYEFLKVPMRFGLNDFQLVFHGPEGQRRKENLRMDLSNLQPSKGQFFYRMMGARPYTTGNTALMSSHGAPLNENLYRAESQYGITNAFAVNGALAREGLKDGIHNYLLAGFQGVLPFLTFQSSAIKDQGRSGSAVSAALRSGYEFTSFGLRREEYTGDMSASRGLGTPDDPLKSRTSADLNGSWRVGRYGIQTGFGLTEDACVRGNFNRQLSLNISGSHQKWALGHTLYRSISRRSTMEQATLEGLFRVSREGEIFSARGEFSYQRLQGSLKSKSGQGIFEWRPTEDSALQASITRQIDIRQTQTQLSYFKMRGLLSLGLQASHSKSSGFSINATIQASFGREPRSGRWAMQANSLGTQGAVSAVSFVDENGNSRKDAGERIVEAAEYLVNGSSGEKLIDDPSIAFIGNAGRYNETILGVSTESIEDPYLKPQIKTFRVLPRPGKVFKLDFPLVSLSEITGTARFRDKGGLKELPGLEIDLVNEKGEVVKSQVSAYDGFFDFTEVPPGTYMLSLSSQAKAIGLGLATPRTIQVHPNGKALDGMDLIVELKPAIQPPGASGGANNPSEPLIDKNGALP